MTTVDSFPIEHPLPRQNARVSEFMAIKRIILIKAHLIRTCDVICMFFPRIVLSLKWFVLPLSVVFYW